MNKRLGYTLIETLVVIAGSGVVMATATALLHSMFKADGATRDRAAGEQTLRRLSDDFRDDAHAAVKLSAIEAAAVKTPPAWEFQMPESARKVRYEAAPGRLMREEQVSGKMVRREAYRLSDGAAATIRLESGPPVVAVLQIVGTGPAGGRFGTLPLRVEAALGSDHRFAKLGGK
jgi:type II secretory pathway component PulJ